jgi:uncharacterized membrane protein YedE/YeeE
MDSALALGILIVQFIKRKQIKVIDSQTIVIADKEKGVFRYLIGDTVFGLGWALAEACTGLMFVLAGAGYLPILIVILGAVLGTWVYGLLKEKLPH